MHHSNVVVCMYASVTFLYSIFFSLFHLLSPPFPLTLFLSSSYSGRILVHVRIATNTHRKRATREKEMRKFFFSFSFGVCVCVSVYLWRMREYTHSKDLIRSKTFILFLFSSLLCIVCVHVSIEWVHFGFKGHFIHYYYSVTENIVLNGLRMEIVDGKQNNSCVLYKRHRAEYNVN